MPTNAITTRTFEHAGAFVVEVTGEVDLFTSAQFGDAIDAVLARHPALIVDLSTVTFLASVGLRILTDMNERQSAVGRFVVVADGAATSRLLQVTKLDEIIELHPTLAEAVAALSTSG